VEFGKLKLALVTLVVVAMAESIGPAQFQIGPGKVVLLPMLWALLIAASWGLAQHRLPPLVRIPTALQAYAGGLLNAGLLLFIVKLGLTVGAALPMVRQAGWALVFQEFGHALGTLALGLPLALLLGVKREAIGATFSVGREGNLVIIGEKYGMASAEGRGVLAEYITGTVVGALFIAVFAGFLASLHVFDPRSLAMGAGVGSGSLMAAAIGAIAAQQPPEMVPQLTAIAAASNLLTSVVGFYFTLFLSLPLCAWLYGKLEPVLGRFSKPRSQEAGPGEVAAAESPAPTLVDTLLALGGDGRGRDDRQRAHLQGAGAGLAPWHGRGHCGGRRGRGDPTLAAAAAAGAGVVGGGDGRRHSRAAALRRQRGRMDRQAQLPRVHHTGAGAGRLLGRQRPADVSSPGLAHRRGLADRDRRHLHRRHPDRRILSLTHRRTHVMYRDFDIEEDTRARMLGWRRDIHANPETAFEEHRTANVVAQALMLMGLPVHRGLAGTGVVGTLRHGDGPSIALRADLDALNMQELGTQAHASKCVGKMHACGHDGHTAMLLGAAEHLARHKPFRGTVHFIFQPAEENEGGGRVMVEQGLFEQFPADAVYGMHNLPGLPRGLFAIRKGTMTAYLDTFEIVVNGKGSHGAMPETGIDSVVVASQLVNALQTIVSRRIGATDSAVVSVTQIHGGDTWNVIPETVVLRGTVRTLDAGIQDKTQAAMQQICEGVAATHGAKVALDYRRGYPGVVNTPAETDAAVAAAASLVDRERVHTEIPPSMGSEDFAFMLQKRPGAYIAIGAGEGPDDPNVHNPYYDFNDAILPLGAAYWVALVKQQLPAQAVDNPAHDSTLRRAGQSRP
jgi:amidohydrolase/hippurate hydrolase